jgi:CDP-diacylglycerol---glycerol-3-phosphate 3-phosphatidyltransferase
VNVPNQLTCARIALTAVFLALMSRPGPGFKAAALVAFLLASATDYWDGRIARRSGQITQFGRLMDPIADKLLTLSAFFSFVFLGLIPLWTAGVVAARDAWVTGTRFTSRRGQAQEARKGGKGKTFFQFVYVSVGLVIVTLRETGAWRAGWEPAAAAFFLYGMLAVVAFTIWSGVSYLRASKGAA